MVIERKRLSRYVEGSAILSRHIDRLHLLKAQRFQVIINSLETIVGKASREIASAPALVQKLERCHADCSECALSPLTSSTLAHPWRLGSITAEQENACAQPYKLEYGF
jgi:hypothetical protein